VTLSRGVYLMVAHYTVIGNPIAHSLSPQIHQKFAEQTGIKLFYDRSLLLEEYTVSQFHAFLKEFSEQGGAGANVTAPFKGVAFQSVQQSSVSAKEAGAVNTLIFRDQQWICDNTDGKGLIADWKRLGWAIKDKRILMIGAGGAVASVLGEILREQPAAVIIMNRTIHKAKQLVDRFQNNTLSIDAQGPFELIVNATSRGLLPESLGINPLWVKDTYCYDMNYQASGETPFVLWAKEQRALQAVSGYGMLLAQAAESFNLWFNVKPQWNELLLDRL
jgi:shikimate dehydrogenase